MWNSLKNYFFVSFNLIVHVQLAMSYIQWHFSVELCVGGGGGCCV